MHSHSVDEWTHDHVFLGQRHSRNERRIWLVVALTTAMMVGEIVGGVMFGSMAVLADGWHMATHAAALGISAAAYGFARRQARNPRFAFGTGKFGDLAAFSSAIILALIALQVAYESAVRIIYPVPIAYGEAMAIAVLGLAVNLVSAWLLRDEPHDHAVTRTIITAMPKRIITTATTTSGPPMCMCWPMRRRRCWRSSRWFWRCPGNGPGSIRWSASIGSVVIMAWAYGLIRDSGSVLLDVAADSASRRRSGNGWSKTATGSPTCISGRSARATAPRWFRSFPTGRKLRQFTNAAWPTCRA